MEKSDLQRFRNECVAAHNFYRASHGTPPLCWSARLAEGAQNWAEQLASTTTGSLRYSSVKGFGENLACLWGSELNGQKVTRIWYEEGQYFDYGSTRVTSRTRSFCQVIWQGTRELGAGAALTENGKQIIVARYFPPLSKKDVARNVKIPRSTRDGAQPLAYDTRWSRLYVGLKEFHEECLSVHNEYRIRHGAAPLHWSAELAWEAQQWAENLARIGELRHNDDDTVGENLAGMTGGELTGREAVDMWYEEIENYDFDCHGYSEDTSNFTQVIWVASENLGVGRAMEGDLCVVVAFYEPPGNVEGSFSNNVLRMGSAVRKRNSKGPKSFIPPPPDLEGFRLECLVTHNYFRARHGSPPLVLNNALTDEAQYWAERLLVTGATEGLDNSRIGISVAVLESKHVSGIKVSELWYKQILCYNFDSPGFSTETLDFSQLVWMSSRKFGVGKATGPEGVTVVVARYEPVGNIDGLFVQNVKRRGHERGSCEPMIFQVEYKYRFRTDSKSTNSVLSWEHEEAPALICDGDVTKASDVDQIDENKNIVPRPDEEEPSSSLTVSDAFTRLVWIDPNSPTLQRKGVAEETAKEELDDDDDDADDEGEDEDYAEKVDQDEDGIGEECDDVENAKMVYEQENRAEGVDCVSEEAYLQTEEPQLEEADLFSDPEDDLYHRVCEVRRSLSLDSEGTEPETQPGNVLSKVAFFETFQRSFERQSPSNSQSSFRRSLIQDKLEELDSTSEPELSLEKEEGEERQERPQQEHDEPECQLEFDDLFPAHMEGDEGEIHEDMFEDEAGEDEESLVSVSDAEDIVDFAYYDDRPEDVQDYELEDTCCQTNEFIEEESCTMEIFEFSDEDASHQYSDIIDTEDEPILLTRRVVTPLNSGAAAEFLESQSFEVREAEPQDSIDDFPHDYPDELHDTSEATVEVPQTLFTRTLDPEHCYATTKREEIDIRLRELISKIMLIPVDDRPGGSDELSDFGETTEGQLLQNILSRTEDGGLEEKRTPIEETWEVSQKRIVESEKDFVELVARLQREEVKCDKVESDAEEGILEPSKETQRPQSAEIICATLRDHQSELHDKMERVSSDLGLEPAKYLEEETLDGRAVPENVILVYESQLSLAVDDVEPVTENVEAVEREHKNEIASDPERLLDRMQSPTQEEEFAQDEIIISDVSESSRSVESYEVAIRDHHQERDRLLDEIGLVPISPDINLAGEEMLEPLPYEHTPILKFRELPEVKEDITAEVRGDVRCELNVKSEENENEYVSLTAETFQDSNETIEKQIPCEAVFRDHDQERALNIEEREFQLELRPEVEDPNEPVEPFLYCTAPKSIPESQLPEISENIAAELRPEVRSEINIEELFRPYEEIATLQGGKLENAQHVDEMKETMTDKQSHESFYVDDTMTDFSSSFPQHVSNESKNCKPAEELKVAEAKLDNVVVSKVEPEEADIDRRASLFEEKNSFVDSITLKEFSERLHVAGETLNVDPTTLTEGVEIDEQTVDKKQAVQFTEEEDVMTDIPSSSGHIAGECTQTESVEKINEEEYGEFKKPASLFIEEDSTVNALLPDTMSSPKQVSAESKNVESFEEILEEFETSEKSKRTSIFLGDAVTLDEVRTDIQSSPKHLAMQSRDVEPYQEIIEVTDEENKQASRIVEEVPNVETVRTDRPSSPRHLIMESKELETFEKTDDENTFESKRASLFMEETTIVKEATSHASSFPKHIAGEINNEESFEEVDEIATKESNRVSLIVEETMTVGEITTNTKSPPTHLAGERTQNESIDLILEEQCFEGEKRASLFFDEDSSVKEVGASAISSSNQVAGEGKNVENFNEINEEPNEERKRASLFYEEAINEDEILTCTSFSPKQTAEDISNEEIFDEIEQDDTQESKRASLFIEEGVTVDEMITNTSSSRTHGLAGESVNTETFEEVETISDEEKNQTSVFLEEDVFADEMIPARTSFAIHTAREDVCIPLVKKTHEKEDEQDLEHADVWEDDIEVKFGHTELTCLEQNSHIAGEFLDSGMVEATDDDEPPESVYVEEFDEFENSYGTKSFVEPAEIENIAGEMANVANDAEAFEEDARIEGSLGYDENHEIVISTDILETPLNSLHIAGTLSNVQPKEESCEEEKTEKEAFAEKFHELKAHESTVVLKSPQSLLSIAAAVIEHKIDSAQQDSTEEVTMETGLKKQDSKEEGAHLQFTDVFHEPYEPNRKEEIGEKALLSEQSPTMFEDTIGTTDAMVMETETKVPIILVNIAAEVSDNEDDNLVFVKKDSEVETETYEYPEEVAMEYHPDDQEIAISQEVAEVSFSERVLEDEHLVFAENELSKDSEEETETYEYPEEAATGYVPDDEEIPVSHDVAEVSLSELVLEDENLDFAENDLKKDSEVETETYEYPEEAAMEYHPDDQEIPVSHEVAEVSLSELVLEDENLVFAENEHKEDSEVETETQEYQEESAMDYLPNDQVISESHEVSEISVSELLEDKNLVFVENELKKDSEVETEKYEYPDEASMEYLPDDQIICESHEVAEVFVSEHILEQKAKVKQRETVEAFEGSEEGSISELLSESSLSPLRVSDELKDLQDYETINEEYDIETYHSINYEEGDTVSEKSISKCLPPLFITEELVLQEEREDNIEEKKVQDHDNLEERSQGPEIPYVSGQSLETATELSDVGFTDYSVKEELNEREFAEEFMNIESVIVETSRKDHLSPQKNEKGVDLLGKVNAQKPEERRNVTIEQSTIESEPTVSAVSREQKEEKIFDYSWQMENKTEEPIVEKAGKREVTKAQKTTTDSENEGTFTEHGLMLPRDEESFSVSQSESLIVSEQGRQMKILHEKEEKVDVFSTRTKQSISHVAAESTSRTLEYNFESHSACIFRQVATSDKLSESILDKETKDQELEKYEKEFSEEETEVRLLKNEVLECKVAEQQLPTSLGNPHAIVERETTLVKTLVTRSPSKDDQEEVLLREDRLTAILKDDEAMLEQESAVEHFEEEIDVMRMDEALSEEEFRGEGAESIDREQSRPSRSDSVEEDDTCNESEAGVEDKRNLNEAEKDDAGNFQGAAEDVVYESDANSLMKTSVLDEEVEVKVFEEGGSLVEENHEIVDENETRTETPVFEEELDVSALPTEKDIIYAECTEEDSPVDSSVVFEEEVEVSALPDEPIEELEVESFAEREEEDVDRTAVYEEELEITACKTQLEQEIQERESDNQVPKVEEGCEITGSQVHEERTNEENLMDEHEDSLTNESEAGERLLEKEDIGEKSDDEGTLENLKIRKTRKQPLDLSQVDFYDEDESATATRYYVEFSSTESLEPSYEEVDEDEAPFSETYVRQGEPLEENLEEFILVRYGDEFESSGEEDISDHREIYVIPEEENDIENHNIAETTTDEAHAKRPAPETLYEDEFENMGLGEIRESPEFDIDDSDELDEEEQRQLEEYERLESFVILEEKLSQVESDEDGNGDIPLEEDDENVFYSDVHSSGEETLHEDELGETLTTGSLRQTAAFTEKDEAPLGRDCTQMEEQDCGEQQETLQECSPETKEPVTMTGFSDSQEPVKVSPDDPGTTKDSEIEIVTEAPEDNKENFELRNTKEEKAEHSLSSDSSGEQCMSAEGSVSSTTSLDLEGLDSFEQECLLQHNLYRRQHKVKPLKWSEELAEGAKKWAEHLASMKSLESFEGKEVGENITSMQGKELNGCETADLWYKEAMDYNFEDPAFNAKCGRFTQVVWASSREFGVAKCIAEDGTEYIVARYKPAGNILGEFKDNVKPPRDTLKRRRSSVRRRSKSGAHLTPAEKEKFKTECVVSHNYYRTFHDAPPLRWSPLLAAEAQNYAERLAKTDSLTHSGQKDRGENLAFTWDIPLSAREAIDMWYDEVQDYDFENPGFTYDTGHFTQLIWVGTEEFGMGMTVAPDGKNIVVGRYFPPGNMVGQFKENVRPREIEAIP